MKKEKLSLSIDNDGGIGYIDNNSCSWEDPLDWFWSEILGGCGCGTSDSLSKKAYKVLKNFSHSGDDWDKRYIINSGIEEVFAHWFDSKGLTEHGGSVYGSWLTDYGKEVYDILYNLKEKGE